MLVVAVYCTVGVSLTVPEGAVAKGSTEVMFVVVLRDDKDRPKLSGLISVLFLPTYAC